MAFSSQQYIGDGVTTSYVISFPFIDQDHVSVTVEGSPASFSFTSSNIISISPAPSNGGVIQVFRTTPKERLVDYVNGSIQQADDFDLDSNQLIYLIQENIDALSNSLGRFPGSDNRLFQNLDLNGYIAINSGVPSNDNDLARLIDVDQKLLNAVLGDIDVGFATTAFRGIIRLATNQEALDGLNATAAITPSTLKAAIDALPEATVDDAGLIKLATEAAVLEGTEGDTAVTPETLKARLDNFDLFGIGSLVESYTNPNANNFVESTGLPTTKATKEDLYNTLGDKCRYFTSFNTRVLADNTTNDQTIAFKTSFGTYVKADVIQPGGGTWNELCYSADGETWIAADNGSAHIRGQVKRFVEIDGTLLIPGDQSSLGDNDGQMAYSLDGGETYSYVATGLSEIKDQFLFNGHVYIVDINGAVERSSNGVIWEAISGTFESPGLITAISPIDEVDRIIVSSDGNLLSYAVFGTRLAIVNGDEPLFDDVQAFDISKLNGYIRNASINGGGDLLGALNLDPDTLLDNLIYTESLGGIDITGPVKWIAGNLWVIATSTGLRYTVDNFKTIEPSTLNSIMTDILSIDYKDDTLILGGKDLANGKAVEIIDLTESSSQFILPEFLGNNKRDGLKTFIKVRAS